MFKALSKQSHHVCKKAARPSSLVMKASPSALIHIQPALNLLIASRLNRTTTTSRFLCATVAPESLLQQCAAATSTNSTTSTTASTSTSSAFAATATTAVEEEIPQPTAHQLQKYFFTTSIPMVGFGFMDQSILIQAGNAIDCSIGVTFGLATLTAAALGQVVSGAVAVLFGGTLDSIFRKMGLPRSGLSSAQRSLPHVKRVNVAAQFIGVVLGCTLGLVNLYFIDTNQSSVLKLNAMLSENGEHEFDIEVSNKARPDATQITLRGPDVDGMLACITTALSLQGCSLQEVHAQTRPDIIMDQASQHQHNQDGHVFVEDVFLVTREGKQVPDDEIQSVGEALLEATSRSLNVQALHVRNTELSTLTQQLEQRIIDLEAKLRKSQVKSMPKQAEA